MIAPAPSATASASRARWGRLSRGGATAFRRYAEWFVSISWTKFFLLSFLLLIASAILSELLPFSWNIGETLEQGDWSESPARRSARAKKLEKRIQERVGNVDIKIDETGVRIVRKHGGSETPAEKKSAAGAETAPAPARVEIGPAGVGINVPSGGLSDEIKAAIKEARDEIRNAIEDEIALADDRSEPRVRTVHLGDFIPQLAMLLIVISMVIKIVYAGRVKAEVNAAEAKETADAESLKRQVVEARMAAMQAQVEPHFLFNTLASIDHLIEVDPARASTMQKNLISLLRASMPGMRVTETNLGRELAVVRPYLEILRVRMGERLRAEVHVGEDLHSADFPPMMLQSLVENAIKHGLEPKPEGGTLTVSAEVAHGKLEVTVADTGVGFGRAATAGTGVGLGNIRERLKLLYAGEAELRIADNAPSGTRITIVVPYRAATSTSRA